MTTEVATTTQTRSVLIDMATRYGMEAQAFEETVRATAMRPDSRGNVPSKAEFAAFLLVAKEYKLNPLLKEIYAFPAQRGGIVPVVSIDGWVNLVNSNPNNDGFDFTFDHDEKGELISCTCTMHRKDRSRPVIVTEFLSECIRSTDPWKMKHRMLRHKALIQAARYAFGFSGIYDQDEAEKIAEMRDVTPASNPPAPPAGAKPPKPPVTKKDEPKQVEEKVADPVEEKTAETERDEEADAAAERREQMLSGGVDPDEFDRASAEDAEIIDDGPAYDLKGLCDDMASLAQKDLPVGVYLSEARGIFNQARSYEDFLEVYKSRKPVGTSREIKDGHKAIGADIKAKFEGGGAQPDQQEQSKAEPEAPKGYRSKTLEALDIAVANGDEDAVFRLADDVKEKMEAGLIKQDVFDELTKALSDVIEKF